MPGHCRTVILIAKPACEAILSCRESGTYQEVGRNREGSEIHETSGSKDTKAVGFPFVLWKRSFDVGDGFFRHLCGLITAVARLQHADVGNGDRADSDSTGNA